MPRCVEAVRFLKFMKSGRTSPLLLGCEDEAGRELEFVVKLKGNVANGGTGLACELFSSRLAGHFGLLTPAPALVRLGEPLVRLIENLEPQKSTSLHKSIGLNFGSEHLTGVTIWPTAKDVPDGMRIAALTIFAFDALIQNDDRRRDNPNLFSRGDDFILFDHELAFGFLYAIGHDATPWRIENHKNLDQHVFYHALRKRAVDVNRFTARLASLDDALLERLVAEIPSEWWSDNLGRVSAHLKAMRENANAFAEQILRRLAR
jgi:hypothetical protein